MDNKQDLVTVVTQLLVRHGDNDLLDEWEIFLSNVEMMIAFHKTMYGDSQATPPQGVIKAEG